MAPFSSTITISAPTLPTNVHNNVFEVENDDVFGNLNWIDDKLAVADDLFANNQNNNTLLWLPDDNLFQLLPELEFQASSLSPCSPDDHLLGSIHSPHDEVCNAGVELLEKVDRANTREGEEVVIDTKHKCSPRDGNQSHHNGATRKMSKKRNSVERSRRRQINNKLQALQSLLPHPSCKVNYLILFSHVTLWA
ncbi:uncharacterized protein [Spinacia oleracea]|uniref:BHLH domain-containing protein n=1 Tax=Spinacia oleracea TaxID=3562 RepID=A0ABM3RGP2_SPIOL|nr:uncharacterized protein LOC130469468 [Spinacia oleracea]